MKPFQRAHHDPQQTEELRLILAKSYGAEYANEAMLRSLAGEVWINDLYQVSVFRDNNAAGQVLIHLSIRRLDREIIHDWRELQEIKNRLVGRECEAVELYPAESRMVDTANQYHLFCVPDPTYRFPFGFGTRLVSGEDKLPPLPRVKQRPRSRK